jgi:hypothetical protein
MALYGRGRPKAVARCTEYPPRKQTFGTFGNLDTLDIVHFLD